MDSPMNIYKDDINFAELASQDPEFAKFLKSNSQLDFSDPDSIKQLTTSLLKRDFNLKIHLPADRLCPPVPNRLLYVLWLQDLLASTSPTFSSTYDPTRHITGLDIGTGASCVYPLLGCALHPKWRFIATDIDEKSLSFARSNIDLNDLGSRIKLLKTAPSDPLIPLDTLGLDSISFTMSNPPFYPSLTSLLASAALKSRPPLSACTGSETEMVVSGGEESFIRRQIAESVKLGERIQWYSSMVGKYSTLSTVITELKRVGCANWAVMEFVTGGKTRRWGVAWSWTDLRPVERTARGIGSLAGEWCPPRCEVGFRALGTEEVVVKRVNSMMKELKGVQWRYKENIRTGIGFAPRNVWSRAARRESARREVAGEGEVEEDDEEQEMAFGFKIKMGSDEGGQAKDGVDIIIRWLKGIDAVLFESFCGTVRRKVLEVAGKGS